jgi:acyl carrier protein
VNARLSDDFQPPDEEKCAAVPAETDVEQGPLDRQEVLQLVRDRLADILEIDPAGIAEGASFVNDLDADSLAMIQLVEDLEKELGERVGGFRIEDEDLEDLKTVRDAVDYVLGRVGGPASQ